MKIYGKTLQRPVWAFLAVTMGLLLVVGLSLLFSHFRVLAQPEAGNLVASKSVDPSWARPGENLAYTVYITNTGDEPVWTVWMTDSLPSEVDYSGGLAATTGTPGRAGNVITWTGLLTPDDVVTITFVAQITDTLNEDASFSFVNTATITGAGILETPSVEATAIVTFETWLPLIFYKYPPTPDLNDIPEPSTADNSYTVSWQAVGVSVDRYVLQESTSASFASVTEEWQTTDTSQLVTKGTAHGTLYYRVRADNDDKWGQGPWSAVKSVALKMNYYDSFGSSGSGWLTHAARCCLDGCDDVFGGRTNLSYKYNLFYSGGRYHVHVPTNCYEGGNHGFTRHIYPISLAPGVQRPSTKTCIQVRGSFEKHIWNESWGLVFASGDDLRHNYSIWVDDRGDWAITERTDYLFPGPNYSQGGDPRIHIEPPAGGSRWPVKAGTEPNVLGVEITGGSVKFFINGYEVRTYNSSTISSLKRVGLIGGNNEWGDIQIGYDYFYVDEGCDTY